MSNKSQDIVTKAQDAFESASGSVSAASPSQRAKLQEELELAYARREMRAALVAKLVEESKTRPMRLHWRALRSALIKRDLIEEESESLERDILEREGEGNVVPLRRDNKR